MRVHPSLLALSSAVALFFGAPGAHANSFDDVREGASDLPSTQALVSLFWSQEASCSKVDGDLKRRQCEGVRRQRRLRVQSQTYLLEVGAPAIAIEAKEPTAETVSVVLRGCLSCQDDGALILGTSRAKKGKSTPKNQTVQLTDTKITAPILDIAMKRFADAAHATHWSQYVAPRLRAQLLVKLPKSASTFRAGERSGYNVEVVGYRVYDPCRGEVISESPARSGDGPTAKAPVLLAACEGEPELQVAKEPEPATDTTPKLPEHLTTSQVKTAMAKVTQKAKACYAAYGIPGLATFKFTIRADGTIHGVEQLGDFADTPTGMCLNEAMQLASFPKTKKRATSMTFPLVLQ